MTTASTRGAGSVRRQAARGRRSLRSLVRQLLLVDACNRAVFACRFFWFVRVCHRLREHVDGEGVIARPYSMGMLTRGRTSNRPLRLIRPLSVLDHVSKDARVLSIGCRFETELLYLVGHGFAPGRIRGMDMISYSPWVDVGNMHSMPYATGSWDVVILGWVLAYSDEPERAAAEILRVVADHGVVAIGVSYYPEARLRELDRQGSLVGGIQTRIQTVDAILALFGGSVDEVFFRHDAADPGAEGVCCVIFSVRKEERG